ncbi:hypothetical protein AtEden1_Chr1g0017251 [Arabidopsis thaliana]
MENEIGDDWREEVFQKLRSMRERYLPHVTDVYQRLADKLNHEESLPQLQRSKHIDKLQSMKTNIEQLIQVLSLRKRNIMPILKDCRWDYYEKRIIYFLITLRTGGAGKTVQQRQLQDQSHNNQGNAL